METAQTPMEAKSYLEAKIKEAETESDKLKQALDENKKAIKADKSKLRKVEKLIQKINDTLKGEAVQSK